MERRIILGVLGAALFAIAAAILLPGGRPPDPNPKLPWDIAPAPGGGARVFGITLGQTPLQGAREIFEDDGEVSLFRVGEDRISVEAFFGNVYLSGLRGDFVLTLDVAPDRARTMLERGLRISKAESGDRKVTLAPEDLSDVVAAAIKQISYLPAARLEPDLIVRRFGNPTEKIVEPDSGIAHWLYPDLGLDIASDAEGRAVLQYVAPADFRMLEDPLRR